MTRMRSFTRSLLHLPAIGRSERIAVGSAKADPTAIRSERPMAGRWRRLRVNDLIRVIGIPKDWDKPNHPIDPSTRDLFERLITRRRPLRICEIDERGIPWIQCRFRLPNGDWDDHSLAVDTDDSWTPFRKPRP